MAEQPSHSEESDVDYEKEVLQLGRIWNEIKRTTAEPAPAREVPLPERENDRANAQPRQPTSKAVEPNDKKSAKRLKNHPIEEPVPKPTAQRKSPNATDSNHQSRRKPVAEEKKSTHLQRNPKTNDPKIITVTTNQRQRQQSADSNRHVFNHKNEIVQDRLVMNPLKRSDEKQMYDMRCSIEQKNQQLALLRISNNRYHDKIAHLQREIDKRDDMIATLRSNERLVEKEKHKLYDNQHVWTHGAVEYQNLRRDVKRLMEMLKTTTEYREFANFAIAEGGVRFLHETNKKVKTNLDKPPQSIHFCSCNKSYIPEPALWIPQNVYSHAKKYVSERKGDLTMPELELLLYDLNKMWRERQKSIVDSLNAIKANELGTLRRKLQNLTRHTK